MSKLIIKQIPNDRIRNRVDGETCIDRLTQLGKKAGVDGLRPHRLRHTFGTFLYNYELDLFYVKNQLGHSSVNTTEIYAKTPESSKSEQMKGFEESLDM